VEEDNIYCNTSTSSSGHQCMFLKVIKHKVKTHFRHTRCYVSLSLSLSLSLSKTREVARLRKKRS
jgi:hypothetical protein